MTTNTVLLVEDDKLCREALRDCLQIENFVVFEAMAAQRSMSILREHKIDIILLDLGLPDQDGIDLIPTIREITDAPIIIVSGNTSPQNKITGLRKGADDYVQKPFNFDVLTALVKANLRRSRLNPSNQNKQLENKVPVGSWTLDRTSYQIYDADQISGDLTYQEFLILDKLVRHTNCAVKRDDLCEAIREKNYIPTERAIDIKISRIRKKLETNDKSWATIKTIRNVGYMLINQNEQL